MDRKEAAERIQEVMTIIKTQHMCKDIDGECTAEDRETYIQRFEALRMAVEVMHEPELDIERMVLLLEKCKELLEKQKESPFVLNMLTETVFYDGADCDGYCLVDDIRAVLSDMRGEKK